MKVSVCIAHINEPQSLFFTAMGLTQELHRNHIDHEIIISDNGSTETALKFMKTWETLDGYYDHIKSPITFTSCDKHGTIPNWQHCASLATGDVLMFCDQHILVAYDFFEKQLALLTEENPVLYACCGFWDWVFYGSRPIYHYSFAPDDLKNFFVYDIEEKEPYPILTSQFGAVLVLKSHYDQIGGLGRCFDEVGGYTAEETMLPVKTRMFGKTPLFNPQTCYIHAPLPYRNTAGNNRNRPESLCVAAYALGGEQPFQLACEKWHIAPERIDHLRNEAQPERDFLEKNAVKSYAQVLGEWHG